MIVVDASALVHTFLGTDLAAGVEAILAEERALMAPAIVDSEVTTQLRRAVLRGLMSEDRAELARARLKELIPEPISIRPLLDRAWAMRANITVADALYVATAELFDCRLLTSDARLQHGAVAVSSAEVILC